MSDGQVEASYREIIFHNDDETPIDFVVSLLHAVFKKQRGRRVQICRRHQ